MKTVIKIILTPKNWPDSSSRKGYYMYDADCTFALNEKESKTENFIFQKRTDIKGK